MRVNLEKLHHYNCDACKLWWTVADIVPVIGKSVHCPHCAHLNMVEEIVEHPVAPAPPQGLQFYYKNWKGETRLRHVQPLRLEYDSTEWHTELGWLLVAIDLEKQEERRFAVKDIQDELIKTVLLLLAPLKLNAPDTGSDGYLLSAESARNLAQSVKLP